MARGYEPVERAGTQPWIFVLGDEHGHEVDVHSFTFDEHGENIYGVAYPAESLTGTGSVGNQTVGRVGSDGAEPVSPSWDPDSRGRDEPVEPVTAGGVAGGR
jgi:lincosamide nucleotidyltransferase A/C/D/E